MKKHLLNARAWFFLALTVVQVVFLFNFVDLQPQVSYDVFFSNEDPSYKSDIKISKIFPRNDIQLLINFGGNLHQSDYQSKVKEFGDFLLKFDEVKEIKSIMHGPPSVTYAQESPLWRRILIPRHGSSSNMLVILKHSPTGDRSMLISKIENLKNILESENFTVNISGFPYIMELIKRHLTQDLRTFSILAFFMFGLVVISIFHSWKIFLGIVISCFNAAALTLICTHLLDIKIGILTANLATIIFVLTLSHMIFLTFNWKHVTDSDDKHMAAREAMRITFPASFWSMCTGLLGFLSLFFVQAKPVRELGAAGAIGTVIAFLVAYGIYPAFLALQKPSHQRVDAFVQTFYKRMFKFFEPIKWVIITFILVLAFFTLPHLRSLDLDPSLLAFFSPKSDITAGLKEIDQNGGSNPLVIVVKAKDGTFLSTKANVKKLMELQLKLEGHRDVGTLLSLPLLIDEARQSSKLSFLISNKKLLEWLSSKKHGAIAKGFVSEDQKLALLFFRMNEEGRTHQRLEVIAQLEEEIKKSDFEPYLTGGIYALQGHLSQHVAGSLIYGLGHLLLFFVAIAFLASLRIKTALSMGFSIGIIPLCILGVVGALNMPLDIIAAPAANIAIAIGIDAMLHMVNIYRRLSKTSDDLSKLWDKVRERMWEPVMTSMLIVSSGFAIFFFSSFPPTQRFGGQIVWGTIVSAFSALYIFPVFLQNRKSKVRVKPAKSEPPFSRLKEFKDN